MPQFGRMRKLQLRRLGSFGLAKRRIFHLGLENKSPIEERIGKELIWEPSHGSRACHVYVAVGGTIDDNEQKLAGLAEWAAPLVVKFRELFGPLAKNIHVGE